MRKSTKGWLIVAAVLIFVGCMLFAGVMMLLKWDFTKLSTVEYETNTYAITEPFTHISIAVNTADIMFAVSQDDTVSVVCYEQKDDTHSVGVDKNILMVNTKGARKWYRHIGINFGTPKITIYLPASAYGSLTIDTDTGDVAIPADFTFDSVDVGVSTGRVTCFASVVEKMKIKTTTGNISLSNVSVGALDLTASTGKIEVSSVACRGDVTVAVSTGKAHLKGVTCRSLTSRGSTGDLTLRDVVAAEAFSITRSTGNITFDACDAATLTVTTDTGDIEGTLLTEKVFITHTDTGRVNIPDTTNGGRCELTTDTGDIKISIQ